MALSHEIKLEVVEMNRAGMSAREISQEVGVHVQTVYNVLKEFGVEAERRSLINRMDPEEVDVLFDAYERGAPVRDLLQEHGLSQNQFYALLRLHNVSPRTTSREAVEARELQREHTLKLYLEGVPLWKIRKETGASSSLVNQWVHEKGLPLRQPKISAKRYEEDDE